MEYANVAGLRCSRLALGTAQLGFAYGLSNRVGQPTKSDAKAILSVAFDGGVNVLDTAYLYGDSEALIGEVVSSLSAPHDLVIVTKLKKIPLDRELGAAELRAEVDESIHTSLKRLRLESVPVYLMHNPQHLTAFGGSIVEQLLRLREQGLVRHVGISIYTAEEADMALNTEGIEALQVPFNVFDQRLVRSGLFERAGAKNVAVFVRSVYLKGVVVMDVDEVPEYLDQAIPLKRRLDDVCAKFGRPVTEVALKYPLTVTSGTSVLTGVEQVSQMRANLKLFDSPALPGDMVSEIQAAFEDVPEFVLDPRLWPQEYVAPQKRGNRSPG